MRCSDPFAKHSLRILKNRTMHTIPHRRTLSQLWAIFFIFLFFDAGAGEMSIGQWRHHLPNNTVIQLAETPERIIGATPYGLVVFNKTDNSMERINKVDGLNDFGISTIAWSEQHNALLIGYENGNFDIMTDQGFLNIPDILQASILGSKRINRIVFNGSNTLLACDFGIVVLDIAERLIRDTWNIGPHGSMVNVNDLLLTDTMLFAATNAGLLYAHADAPNLADFNHWHRAMVSGQAGERFGFVVSHNNQLVISRNDGETDSLYVFDGQSWQGFLPPGGFHGPRHRFMRTSNNRLLLASGNRLDIFGPGMELVQQVENYFSGTPTPNDALYDQQQSLWIADNRHGLVRERSPHDYDRIVLSGPDYPNAFGLAIADGRLWVAPGSVTYGGSNSWNQNGYFFYKDGKWTRYSRADFPLLVDVADVIRITIDPGNPERAYASAWYGGLAVISTEGVLEVYNENNSTLQLRAGIGDRLRVGGSAMDRHGNLWVTNSEADRPLSVKKSNGDWMAFTSGGTFGPQAIVGDIIIDNHDQKWVNLPTNGIFLFKENSLEHTGDFHARRLTTQTGNGGLPSSRVHSMALDHNGYVWVGTDQGVGVFYAPSRALTGEPFDAHRIIVEQDDGFAGYLLETETVTSITVDGSNKKWFGTERSGAFLLSADGRETILHFTKDNSPLPSNYIFDIAINGETGEVFFATDLGLASYRAFATEARAKHSNVYAYPNPVRHGYEGYIAVRGLVRNARVKITDINGNLIWETIAEGGQAVWNGQDLHGRRPSTGVYLVFSTDDDGEETMVTKIMFFN